MNKAVKRLWERWLNRSTGACGVQVKARASTGTQGAVGLY